MKLRYLLPLCLAAGCLGSDVHLVVTAEGHGGANPPVLAQDEIEARLDKKPATIRSWTALRGDQANLELYILIDDGESRDLSLQFQELKNFIAEQPATTRIGLGYLQNGAVRIAAPPTADHAKVSGAIRMPLGEPGISSSPYMAVSDLLKKWPAADARREILLISNGADPWGDDDPQNPYLQKAIAGAQKAGVLVHAFYFAGAGHWGHSFRGIYWGQNYLSELCEETGGEFYWQGTESPVSFAPWLKDLKMRLRNQYLLTLEAGPEKAQSEPVKVGTTQSGVSLESASHVEVGR